jgi:AraC family transcriptional regulator
MANLPHRVPDAAAGLDGALSKRVSVLIGNRSVPLLPGSPVMDSSSSPWVGLNLERHSLGAIEIPEHEHRTLCLHLQTSGPVAMDWQSAGRAGHVQSDAGSLILLAPGTRDSLLWHGPSQRIVVSVEPALLMQAADQLDLTTKTHHDFENRWSLHDDQLRLLLTEMDREMTSGWQMGSLYGDLMAMSLSIALVKKYNQLADLPAPLKGGLSRSNLRNVMAYIEANLERDLRLEELAALAGISVFHFARSFRESFGQAPHQYIVHRRIQQAKLLLARPEWSMAQIASAVGLTSASRFAKIFRAVTGASPTEWRRRS